MVEEAKASNDEGGEGTALPPSGADGAQGKKEKKIPEGLVIPPKKPKLSKAERRALQEQQRAAKSGDGGGGGGGEQPSQEPETSTPYEESRVADPPIEAPHEIGTAYGPGSEKKDAHSMANTLVPTMAPFRDPADIFDHGATLLPKSWFGSTNGLHPAVIALGYKYATGEIRGGNARCRHMLLCFQTVLQDFQGTTTTAGAGGKAMETVDYRMVVDQQILKASFHYWTETCRPHSVSMGNAFTALKAAVASMDRSLSFDEMKQVLLETIHAYSRERIEYADRAIADLAHQKLLHGGEMSDKNNSSGCGSDESAREVILTFGYSEVVDLTLRLAAAAAQGKNNFRVIVVDSQPLLEGRHLLKQLRSAGIECTYVLLNALTYVLQDVTKVMLGASALMSDGSVWGRAGSACVALAARAEHIPVLVLSETYKISNRVQLESLTSNELGAPYHSNSGKQPAPPTSLKRLNLLYDLTPASFVSGIVTELGIIPPTSVAVLLREMNQPQE